MTIYRLPERIPMSLPDTPIALALGNFDGVHTGHRRLLAAARTAAETIPGCLAGAWTFTTLAKEVADVPALTTAEEKLRQFANAGLDFAILEEFSAVRDLSPEEFARYEASGDKNRTLLTFWVLKEAAAKLSGQGLRGYPNHTNFSPEDPRVTELDGCLVAVLTKE